ncbi:MAG: hypothetical protein NVSMB56_09360 [Pyrinomonadaceae bacterium]
MEQGLNQQNAGQGLASPLPSVAKLPKFFLRAKLLPPRLTPELLPRPRLIERLRANLKRPFTLVAASAGYGKTTLVAEFVKTHAQDFIWYQLDHTDADPFVFLGYIAHGLQQVIPNFGDTILTYLQESASELAQRPERAVDVLLNEVFEKVEQQLILVLDDYHHLGAETPVHAVVDRLLAYLPDTLHVIIISRDVPPLAIARLKSKNSLEIVDREELVFNDAETQELFRRIFDLELTPVQLSEYHERTHGWITALQLVRQVAQREASTGNGTNEHGSSDLTQILRQSEREIFDYFAEEVFADEPENVQFLLPRLALLDRIEIETCSRLFPESRTSSLLPQLVRRNVFITLASDERGEEYRFHPLFKSFLRRRLRAEIGQAQVFTEHARIADYYLERGAWEQAMRHLFAAEDHERAAVLLTEKGDEWIANGALSSLVSIIEILPPPVLDAHPRVLAQRAEVARLRGEYQSAHILLRRVITLFQASCEREAEAEALHSLATITRRQGDYETTFGYLDRAVDLTDENSAVRIRCGNTRGLCFASTGDWTRAEHEFRKALNLAESHNDERFIRLITHNLGLPAMMRGDFGEALHWLRRMLHEQAVETSSSQLRAVASTQIQAMPQEATAHLNMARCHLYRGEMAECERHLECALERCQMFNLAALIGEVFECYGSFYRERDDIAHANEFFDRAARAYTDAGIDLSRTELSEERALVGLHTGDLSHAHAQLSKLVETRAHAQNEIGLHTAMLTRGRLTLAQENHAAARNDLEPALGYFRAHDLFYYEAQASIALAACDFAMRRESEMLTHLCRVFELAARYDYQYLLQREATRQPNLFTVAATLAEVPKNLREQISNIVGKSTTALRLTPVAASSSQPMSDLTINLLGTTELFRDVARPLSADAWTTKRARDILCFIASRPFHRASKDTIIDIFWGEADFEIVEKNFHPTISHIRKALNSNQTLKQNFLLYRNGEYLLNPDFTYRIDIEEFDRLAAESDKARRTGETERHVSLCEQAIALYHGEFIQGNYDDWAMTQRAHYREQNLYLLGNLIAAAQALQDWSRSLQIGQRVLQEDPYREDIYGSMMRAHAALENKVAVKELFETLRRLLRKELGVEPSATTQKLYRELIK